MTTYPFKNNMNLGAEETLSDLNNTLKTDQNLFDRVTEQVASALNIYYIPVLIALGAIGNLLSVFVFYRSKLRFQSTSQYLSALAVSDTVFLLQLLPPWLNVVHFSGLFHQRGFCQFFVYISYVSCTLSAWIVVAFTIERFVAVLYPLQRNFVCTVRRARYVIAGIVLGSLLLNIPVLRFAIPTSNDCNIDYEYLVHAARFNLVDTAVSFTVPLAVIIVLNTWIMIGVCRFERARQQLMNAEQIVVLGNRIQQPIRQVGCPRSQQRVTRMLLIVSSVYVCLNLPAYTLRIIAYAYNKGDGESGGRWATLQQVALIFFNTNFGINFILYCLSGQNFRRALKNTMPRFGINARRAYAARRALSSHPARGSNVTTSFISNCTEATSNCGAPAATSTLRRRHPQRYISRWTFDNSRQRRAQGYSCGSPESIELRAVDPGHHRFRNLDQPPGDRLRFHHNHNHRFGYSDPPVGDYRFRSSDQPVDDYRYHTTNPSQGHHRLRSLNPQSDNSLHRNVPAEDDRLYPLDSPIGYRRSRATDPPRSNNRFPSADPSQANYRFRSFDAPPRCIRHP